MGVSRASVSLFGLIAALLIFTLPRAAQAEVRKYQGRLSYRSLNQGTYVPKTYLHDSYRIDDVFDLTFELAVDFDASGRPIKVLEASSNVVVSYSEAQDEFAQLGHFSKYKKKQDSKELHGEDLKSSLTSKGVVLEMPEYLGLGRYLEFSAVSFDLDALKLSPLNAFGTFCAQNLLSETMIGRRNLRGIQTLKQVE